MVADQRARKRREITHRAVVLRVGQPVRVHEVRAEHAERFRFLVHQVDERVFAAAYVLGHRYCRIVAGLNDHAAQQILEFHRRAFADEHRRLLLFGCRVFPRIHADRHVVGEMDAARLDFARGDVAGHDLRQARRRHALIDVLLGEHVAGVVVDEDVRACIDLRRRRRRSTAEQAWARFGGKREQWPKGKRDDDPLSGGHDSRWLDHMGEEMRRRLYVIP